MREDIEIVGLVLAVEVITAVDITSRAEEVVLDLVLDRTRVLALLRILAPMLRVVTNASRK